jgi:hypothetical protein
MQNNERIQEIQCKVDSERAAVAALDARISDAGVKQRVRQASFWLDDVEHLFLQSARHETRTPEAFARWLSYAEIPLQWAMERRKQIEELIAKNGPNAVTIGD